MLRVRGRLKLLSNARPGELKTAAFLFFGNLFGSEARSSGDVRRRLLLLLLDRFALPSSCQLPHPLQGEFRSMISTHTVHASTRRRRRRTNVEMRIRGRVPSPSGAKQQLRDFHIAAADIPAHQVRVHGFEISRRESPASQDAIAKSRSEALDLIFDGVKHIHGRAVWHVTVGPRCMAASRSAARIEQTWLHK